MFKLKKLYILLIGIFFLLHITSPTFAQNVGSDHSNFDQAAQILEKAISDHEMMGVAGGFSINGEITFQRGFGFQDDQQKIPFTENTISRLASIAKTMTGVAILQLFEKGKIDMDVPIQTYLPDFPIKSEGAITIRHLLNHTSGIGEYESKREVNNKTQYKSISEAVDIFKNRKLLSIPGTEYYYSSYGYDVLGLIIEKVSGLSYEAYLQKYIWEPTGMLYTSVENFGQNYENKADLFHKGSNGKIKATAETNLSDRIPAGGIQSSVADILKYGNALLQYLLIEEKTFQMMVADPQIRDKEAGNGYGMGWFLYGENEKYGPVYGHSGGQMGCSSFLFILPEIGATSIVISNTSGALQEVSNLAVKLFHLAGEIALDSK